LKAKSLLESMLPSLPKGWKQMRLELCLQPLLYLFFPPLEALSLIPFLEIASVAKRKKKKISEKKVRFFARHFRTGARMESQVAANDAEINPAQFLFLIVPNGWVERKIRASKDKKKQVEISFFEGKSGIIA
jgi:hypothetical protein